MKVIITGASGMVGKAILLECLDHPKVEEVLIIVRRPLDIRHNKLKTMIHSDFSDFSRVKDQLIGYSSCYFALGISAAGLNEEAYTQITYNYTLALADVLFDIDPNITFNYVSGQGTDSSEKGSMMWARVKGKVENDLISKGFKQAFMFRPGVILPLKGIKSKTKSYQFFYDYFSWLLKIYKKVSPQSVCNTTQIGRAMINSSLYGYEKNILNPSDIITLSEINK